MSRMGDSDLGLSQTCGSAKRDGAPLGLGTQGAGLRRRALDFLLCFEEGNGVSMSRTVQTHESGVQHGEQKECVSAPPGAIVVRTGLDPRGGATHN